MQMGFILILLGFIASIPLSFLFPSQVGGYNKAIGQ